MSVSDKCCVLSGRSLCDGLITRPEKSYRVCVCVCDHEATIMRGPSPLEAVEQFKKMYLQLVKRSEDLWWNLCIIMD
jgi:hypothetical protein